MTRKIGRTRSFNDTATIGSSIVATSGAEVTLATSNPNRLFFGVSVDNDIYPEQFQKVWIKLQSSGTDTINKGIMLSPGGYWEMPVDNIYTGEISAMSQKKDINLYTNEY